MNCTLSARRLLTSRRNWLYLRRERLHLSARSKHSRSYAASAKDRNVTNACIGTGRLREQEIEGGLLAEPRARATSAGAAQRPAPPSPTGAGAGASRPSGGGGRRRVSRNS